MEVGCVILEDMGLSKQISSLLLTYHEGEMIDNRCPLLRLVKMVYLVVRTVTLPPPRPPGLYKAVALASLLEKGLELWLAYFHHVAFSFSVF